MIFPRGATARTDPAAVSDTVYDAVIVGGGISGSIIADQLSQAGQRVLILEAGPAEDLTISGYDDYLTTFYGAVSKDNQSPYPVTPGRADAQAHRLRRITPGQPDASGYLVQNGPYATDSTYTRVLGGTTMHWEAKMLRMLPEDFEMASRYGQGLDWPIGYDDLEPYYRDAEREIGVSADVDDQAYLGMQFPPGYVFPMRGLPLSYLDQMVAKGVDGTGVDLDGEHVTLKVRPLPAGPQRHPQSRLRRRPGIRPRGRGQHLPGARWAAAARATTTASRSARYRPSTTRARRWPRPSAAGSSCWPRRSPTRCTSTTENGRVSAHRVPAVSAIRPPPSTHRRRRAGAFSCWPRTRSRTPRLMLASGLNSTSGLMGRQPDGPRVPAQLGAAARDRGHRARHQLHRGHHRSARRRVPPQPGRVRRRHPQRRLGMGDRLADHGPAAHRGRPEQVRPGPAPRPGRPGLPPAAARVHARRPADPGNRVSVDPAYRDPLGNMRPVITYSIPDYTMRGAAFARRLARRLFERLGAEDYTAYDPADYGYVTYEGQGYAIRGGNHLGGTHIMGTDPASSVVDATLRSWDHQNLYLAGGGAMPTIGTANVTLTIAALCFKSAGHMIEQLRAEQAPAVLSGS